MRVNILKPIMIFMTRYYLNDIYTRFKSACKNKFKVFLITIFSITVVVNSCEEEPSLIGNEILPESDFVDIASTDTLSVFSYTAYEDSIKSDNPASSFLGSIYDPYFGITKTEAVTQLRLREEWNGQSFFVDSVKLNLALYNVSGDVNGNHTLRFQEIAEQIYLDSTYYSNKDILLADDKFYDIILPKLKIDTVNYIEEFVPNEFGERLMRDTSKLFHDNSRPDFRAFFKGLKFSILSLGDPVFATFSLAPPSGGYYNYFTVYYTESGGTPKEYYFILDAMSKNARFNLYTHDFTAAAPGKEIKYINQPVRDTVSYVQGLNGAFTKISMPGLEQIKNDPSMTNIAVNRARLIIPVFNDGKPYYGSNIASQLFMRYKTDAGLKYFVPDYDPNNTFFDGMVDTTANVVRFNIASFVQKYFEDKSNSISPEVEIFVAPGSTKNIILNTGENLNPARFEFTYTKF